ncbi:4-hydroxy-tetrahydrodipicolinate synthase [Gorillibacterium sp. sgz5001074]|uniref:4-hydroxy-tetrahydrodipicolinate synthase n=1 Tax=Gorillibacterium sp. sgz5001074 TaxID=3446695 RepID=UPI003F672F1E
MANFGRLVTAMVTPFDEQLQVSEEQLEALVEHLIEGMRCDSLVVCGTTGESPTLTDSEKSGLFESVVRLVRGRAKVIAGTGSYDTAHTIHLTEAAEKAGADGVLLVAPYYNRPSQEGLYQHFKAVAQSTRLPIMLYNIPSRCGINVDTATTLRLAREFPNIVASKEAHSDLDHITTLVSQGPEHFRVYCGDDSLTLPFLSIGAYGVVSVAGHIVGAQIKSMIEAYADDRPAEARRLHQMLFPVFRGMFHCPNRVPNPAAVKHALNVSGIPVGGLRLPMVPVNEAEGRFIEELLQSHQV